MGCGMDGQDFYILWSSCETETIDYYLAVYEMSGNRVAVIFDNTGYTTSEESETNRALPQTTYAMDRGYIYFILFSMVDV